jgi:hypothetical protein
VLLDGIAILKNNIHILDDVFEYYTIGPMNTDYGKDYIDKIKVWFCNTKIPVVQAWSYTPAQVPQISIQLASEAEREDVAALGDHWGMGHEGNIGVNTFNVNLDVHMFGTKNTDEILWIYYIVSYILFKRKRHAEHLGLQQGTFSATDYARDMPKLPENIWVRTIKYRAMAENFWSAERYLDIDHMEVDVCYEPVVSLSEDN